MSDPDPPAQRVRLTRRLDGAAARPPLVRSGRSSVPAVPHRQRLPDAPESLFREAPAQVPAAEARLLLVPGHHGRATPCRFFLPLLANNIALVVKYNGQLLLSARSRITARRRRSARTRSAIRTTAR